MDDGTGVSIIPEGIVTVRKFFWTKTAKLASKPEREYRDSVTPTSRSSSGVSSGTLSSRESLTCNNCAVFLRGQGDNQGAVKMDQDGKLTFAPLNEAGTFFETPLLCDERDLCYTYESRENPGFYLWADIEIDSTVSGQILKLVREKENVYWRKREYREVFGTSRPEHYCLQYWGDSRYRHVKEDQRLYMVAETESNFSLKSSKDVIKQYGVFSFT